MNLLTISIILRGKSILHVLIFKWKTNTIYKKNLKWSGNKCVWHKLDFLLLLLKEEQGPISPPNMVTQRYNAIFDRNRSTNLRKNAIPIQLFTNYSVTGTSEFQNFWEFRSVEAFFGCCLLTSSITYFAWNEWKYSTEINICCTPLPELYLLFCCYCCSWLPHRRHLLNISAKT